MEKQSEFLKFAIRGGAIVALLMLVPFTAMQFSSEVNWSPFDFVAAFILIFGTAMIYKFISMRMNNFYYRAAVGIAVVTGLMIIWSNLAVGIIGNEDNPVNLIYFAVLFLGFIAAVVVKFKPKEMALTLSGMASAIVLIAIVVLIGAGVQQIGFPNLMVYFGFHGFFAGMFLISAVLFHHAANKTT